MRDRGPGVAAAGDFLEQALVESGLRLDGLDVDDGLALHFNRLFQLADGELRVYCRREPCRQNDVGALNCLETAGGHPQLISAEGQQVKEEAAVGVGAAGSRNHQGRAVHLYGRVGHDGPGSISDYTRNFSGCGYLCRQ